MRKREPREEGFTLIEVLAATVILSVVSLAMMTFYIQAMSYNKGNQSKTVMVNLARNALFYMEKQSYVDLKNYFANHPEIDLKKSNCYMNAGSITCPAENDRNFFNNMTGIWDVFNPEVNGKHYEVVVTYQKGLVDAIPASTKFQYLIPINVTVKDKDAADSSNRYQANVEGYVLDESIR
jgi:prepilin-type N-terminal cleavage/methylation domain-containing protein